ncbi:MAG: S-layer homology domain-containing protein [Microcoleaceae cyanobacterium]
MGNQINPTYVQGSVKFGMSAVSLKQPLSQADYPFKDIIRHWAEEFILRLSELKIISSFPDNTFRPNESLTRTEYAALIANIFDLLPIQKATNFTDITDNFWAKTVIKIASKAGFIVGFPDSSFRPHQNLTRIQAILSLVKGLKLSGGISEILTVYRDRDSIPSYAVDAVATATTNEIIVNYPQPVFLSPQHSITCAEVAAIIYQVLVLKKRVKAIDSPYIIRSHNTTKMIGL